MTLSSKDRSFLAKFVMNWTWRVYDAVIDQEISQLKNYSKELDDQLAHLLLTLNTDLTFIQHFHKISDEKSKSSIGRRLNRLSGSKNKNAIVLELKAALESLNAGEITMYESRQAIQIRTESAERLTEMKLQIRNLIEHGGHNASLISMNTGALYASMWPSQRFFNDQLNVITSENAANFITFTTMTTGRTKNAWGDEPVNYFSTSYSNLYGFNFQITSENRAPGHTLIIGSTGSGKTVLANFLIASALKYPGIKVRSFDSLLGLYVFTQLNEGIYQSFDGTCGLNPCNLDFAERPENISKAALFLQSFLTTMAGSVNDLEAAKIAEEINIFMQADKSDHEYTLEGLMVRFEGNTADRVKIGLSKKLNKFAPNTPEGNYFYPATNKQKLLSFSSQLCTFDFKDILATNNTTLIGLITSYIIYKLYVDESPMLIFIDELPAYIKSPIFREMAAKLLAEGRKLNKVLMAAVQNIDQITNTPEGASSLVGNFKHFLIYPIPNMSESDKFFLRNDLGLSERDIYWLAQSSGNKREVLSVEVEGEQGRSSVRVSVDLAPLGPILKGLLSDNSEVQRLRECELTYQDSAQVRKAFLGLDF